jgi:hypothetical protein
MDGGITLLEVSPSLPTATPTMLTFAEVITPDIPNGRTTGGEYRNICWRGRNITARG